jgi:glycosyltransferase 2 family protein
MPRTLRALLLAAGAALLVWLIASVGAEAVLDLLRRVRWALPAVSITYLVHVTVRAFALWRSLPPALVPFAEVLRVRLAGEAVEMLTFTGPLLAEPAKGWLLKRKGLSGAEAFGGVAVEYLLYTTVSAWMATAALSILTLRGVLPEGLRAPVMGVIAALIAFTVGLVAAAATGVGLIVPTLRAMGVVVGRASAAAARLEPIERVLVGFLHERPRRLVEVLVIESVAHALLAFEIWLVVRSVGFALPIRDALVVEGAVKFISVAFFFVPGQVGASEGVYALLFRALGLPAAVGLTVALVRRVRALIVAGVGVGAGSNL